MTGVASAPARREVPVFFPAGRDTLFGMFAHPTSDPRGVALIAVPTAGQTGTSSRNSFNTALARLLVGDGYHVLRFDYHGFGESTGFVEEVRLSQPFTQDVLAAVRWVESQGISSFLLTGFCSGGLAALGATAHIADVRGLVLLSPAVHRFNWRKVTRMATDREARQAARRRRRVGLIRGLLDGDRRRAYLRFARARWRSRRGSGGDVPAATGGGDLGWVNPWFLSRLASLVERRVPVLLVYGLEDTSYEDFQLARAGHLGEIVDGAGSVEILTVPGRLHAFPRAETRRELAGAIGDWIARRAEGADRPDRSGRRGEG